jgi:hypothetical protein
MKTFKFNPLFNALFSILRPVQFNMAALNYIPGTAEPQTFDDIPAGEYVAFISSSEQKTTNDGSQQFIAVEHSIAEGQYAGRKLFNNLFLWSQNETARRIANGTLESICRAQERLEPVADSSELHNKMMIVKVSYNMTRKVKGGGVEDLPEGQRNSITAYKKYDNSHAYGAAPVAQAAAAPQQQAAPAMQQPPVNGHQPAAASPATGAPPWGG